MQTDSGSSCALIPILEETLEVLAMLYVMLV